MIQCRYCKKDMQRAEKANTLKKGAAWGALLLGGPMTMALGAGYLGMKAFNKHVNGKNEVKCPHCGAVNTVTQAEYESLVK